MTIGEVGGPTRSSATMAGKAVDKYLDRDM
jgi:hypothetical protein